MSCQDPRSILAVLLFVALLVGACATPRASAPADPGMLVPAPPAGALRYRVFLVGDAGETTSAPALRLLAAQLEAVESRGAVVFLGDNLYPRGLPSEEDPGRAAAEVRLMAQLRAVEDFPGRVVFLPGNHDWGENGTDREALARQEAFVEAHLDRGNTFLPDDGSPGPIAIELTEGVTLIVLDTQWWLSERPAGGEAGDDDVREPSDVLLELQDVLYEYRNDDLLVVGHHPIRSSGPHGGHFSWREYLTPLPVVGAVRPLYRRFVGGEQDLASPRYRFFRSEMRRLFAAQEHLVYASGHEHSLQHFREEGRGTLHHYVVSGSAARSTHVAASYGTAFAAQARGFVSLQYYDDGSVWMEAWSDDGADDGADGRLLYRARLREPRPRAPGGPGPDDEAATVAPEEPLPDEPGRVVVQAVNPYYVRANGLRRRLQGEGYRALWATPLRVPVLDVGREMGGLTPFRRGGNSQSTTIWLQARDGRTYLLRSVDKSIGRAWPPELRQTVARQLVQDQISMQHPFGALMVPPLADAAGVYHTNPRLVYVPDDPRMGAFRDVLAGQVVLLEERPDGDMSAVASVGHASNVIGSTRLFHEIDGDNDHRVDARAWARARLLDMLVSDHDRTTDNFRWAAFEPYERDSTLTGEAREQGKVYVPVPRDRDMAFLQVDGLAPRLYRHFAEPTWADFDADYGSIAGLNQKPMPLDRRFAAGLTRSDWTGLADTLRAALTDAVIENAVRALPPSVFEQVGPETIRTLRARRDRLTEVAERYTAKAASSGSSTTAASGRMGSGRAAGTRATGPACGHTSSTGQRSRPCTGVRPRAGR